MGFRVSITKDDTKKNDLGKLPQPLDAAALPTPTLPPPALESSVTPVLPEKIKKPRKKKVKAVVAEEPLAPEPVVETKPVTDPTPAPKIKTPDVGSKEENSTTRNLPLAKGPYLITFFGNEIHRFYYNKTWYFLLSDLIQVPIYEEKQRRVETTEAYNQMMPKIVKALTYKDGDDLKEVVCLDYEGIGQLMSLVQNKGTMPGPFSRWILEVIQFPEP